MGLLTVFVIWPRDKLKPGWTAEIVGTGYIDPRRFYLLKFVDVLTFRLSLQIRKWMLFVNDKNKTVIFFLLNESGTS